MTRRSTLGTVARTVLVATLCAVFPLWAAPAPDSALTRGQLLYQAADFEAALVELEAAQRSPAAVEQQQTARWYRVLCLIALDRQAEAQRVLREIISGDPVATVPDDAPPRAALMFSQVRQQLAPRLAMHAYTRATDAQAAGRVIEAQRELTTVLAVIDDPTLHLLTEPPFASLRQDALRLQARLLPQTPRQPAAAITPGPAAPAPAVSTRRPADVPSDRATYVPPRAIYQPLPPISAGAYASLGELVIQVDAAGAVVSAAMVIPISPAYDERVIAAALQDWVYLPAYRNGLPVPATLHIPIAINR